MLKLLDIYLLKRFILNLVIAIITWISIFLIVDIIENVSKFIDQKASFEQFAFYYIYYIPYIISLTLPIAMLLSTLFSLSSMAQHNEIVAQLSSGVSLYRLLFPLFVASILISIGAGFFNELIVPQANQNRLDIMRYDVQKKTRPSDKSRSDIYVQDKADRTVNLRYFNGRENTGRNVSFKTYKNSTIIERIDAEKIIWQDSVWLLKKGKVRRFTKHQEQFFYFEDSVLTNTRIEPKELILLQKKPEEMSFSELNTFIAELRAIRADVKKWLVERHLKISMPFASFIVVLLGAPIASRKRRGGIGFNFGISLLVSFTYFIIIRTGQVLGHQGTLEPLFAAWMGNLIFLTIGLYALLAIRK